jgi:hypothetical protein
MAPFVTAMGVDVTLSVSIFGHSRMEETSITTRISRMLQINHQHLIRDQGFQCAIPEPVPISGFFA